MGAVADMPARYRADSGLEVSPPPVGSAREPPRDVRPHRRLRLLRGRRGVRQVHPGAAARRAAARPAGYAVLLTFEPGDTAVGKELRRIVLSPETGELSHRTEALLYAADKAEHVDTVVQPALDRGEVVITDRYVDTMLAYQGSGRELAARRGRAGRAVGHPRPAAAPDRGARRRPARGAGPVRGPRPDRGRVAGVPRAGPAVVPRPGRRRPRPLPRARRAAPGRGDRRGHRRPARAAAAGRRRADDASGTTWSASTG